MGHSSLKSLICRIDVTAFASVMFALVAMFLIPASIVDHRERISVDLAKVLHPRPMQVELREDVMEIAVTRDGKVYFGLDQVLIASIPDRLHQGMNRGAEHKVYVRADMRARYGRVKQVLDGIRSAGVENIAFVVDEPSAARRDFVQGRK
jgi:biopolymer transport protein TolR